MALWGNLEELLPPLTSGKTGNEPVGLISLVDRAYGRAYKLHKVYSSAMRFHCAARWVRTLEQTLSQWTEDTVWNRLLTSLAESERGSYQLDDDRLTFIARIEEKQIDSRDGLMTRASRNEPVTGTLF
jgi:hypothetical protein